jgi:hypothetical protein
MVLVQRSAVIFFLIWTFIAVSFASQIFVSTTGNDITGTIDRINLPFRTIPQAISVAVAGDTIYVRSGTHSYTAKISISKSGSAGLLIKLWAYPNEQPIIDFSSISGTSTDGFSLNKSYWHFKGLGIKKAPHNGIKISNGDNNIIENCSFHDCGNTGFQLGSSSATTPYPSNNLILNCDSYLNYDPGKAGEDADGFAAKWNIGTGNVFKGCRAYYNSDDGWDLWMAINPVEIDSCWAFRNGIGYWSQVGFAGDGNGIKLGGNNIPAPHVVKQCLSFDNGGTTGRGFDENNNLAGQTLFNCNSFRNLGNNYYFTNSVTQGQHLIENCISYVGVVNITSGTQEHNSWQGFTVSDSDFISLDTAQVLAPRNPDWSLPNITFMHLALGSQLIDVGTDVGIPFNGSAPDLGAFETPGSVHVVDGSTARVLEFQLMQNYPNPFNPSTIIRFRVHRQGSEKLYVINILGQKIADLFSGHAEPGDIYSVQFKAESLPSGVYFSVLESGGERQIMKMIHMK